MHFSSSEAVEPITHGRDVFVCVGQLMPIHRCVDVSPNSIFYFRRRGLRFECNDEQYGFSIVATVSWYESCYFAISLCLGSEKASKSKIRYVCVEHNYV